MALSVFTPLADATAPALVEWQPFYVIAGTSAATLIGLMFVVVTLTKDIRGRTPSETGISLFSTPTVVHFGTALLVSESLCAPFHTARAAVAIEGLAGLAGFVYVWRIGVAFKRLRTYVPDAEDWTWFWALPLVAYASLFAGALISLARPERGIYLTGLGVLLFLFIGIHNAWDIVTFLTTGGDAEDQRSAEGQG